MKIPRIKGGEDPASIVGFEVERMIMPRLNGPHVPRFVARGDFTRQPYIVMEHICGDTLRPLLDQAPLPVDEIAGIGARVAHALHALHCQHLVHLDIKPSNVMFRESGEAVLVDFGLSRHDQLPDLLEEEFSLPMGTGPYMSPEQVQFVRTDPRSDLFALGVMLYHLATGERPFGQPTTVVGLRKRLYTEPMPPRAVRPELPAWFQEVVLRCLEVQPEARYQTAAQLAFDLQNPDQIALTGRAEKLIKAGPITTFGRWFKAMGAEPKGDITATEQVDRSPIIMVAIGLKSSTPELQQKLLTTVSRILQIEPNARLACVSIMKTNRVGMDKLLDDAGNSLHVQQLVGIKHWARPLQQTLKMEDQRLTFHVLEAPDTAAAIVEFATRNQVAHIVMGARGNSALRRYLGSVSAQVVAEAECSVTVVRV
jgi:serine/threonine protein kinase